MGAKGRRWGPYIRTSPSGRRFVGRLDSHVRSVTDLEVLALFKHTDPSSLVVVQVEPSEMRRDVVAPRDQE